MAKNSLPSGVVLHKRKMETSSVYKMCAADVDTWRRSLLNCTMARCVWALLDEELTEHIAASFEEDPMLWLFFTTETLQPECFVKLLVSCWAILGARRKAIHEGESQSPLRPCLVTRENDP